MRTYEVPVVVKPLLPEDVKAKVVPAISKLAEKNGGKLSIKDEWGKRHLAYAIKGIEEGYYIFFNLELEAAKLAEFEKGLKLIPDVLRFLVIREDYL